MNLQDIRNLVESTGDAAFAIDPEGNILAWNRRMAELFGVAPKDAVGKSCHQFLLGMDECGPVCSPTCSVMQTVGNRRPISNFDLSVQTSQGRIWVNVSVLTVEPANSSRPYSIHLLRQIDLRKRLEILVRDFVVTETSLPAEAAAAAIHCGRNPAKAIELTNQELNVLRLLAKGLTTGGIARSLGISPTTVNNHIQHILRKCNAHSRLEAIRRAELAGLLKSKD